MSKAALDLTGKGGPGTGVIDISRRTVDTGVDAQGTLNLWYLRLGPLNLHDGRHALGLSERGHGAGGVGVRPGEP